MPKLEELCEFIIDCLHSTAPIENMETGYYSIRTPDIGRGRLILDSANRVSEETYQQWTIRAIPQYGDLILAREAPIGNVALVPSDTKVCLGQRTVHIRPVVSRVDPIFLVYYLLTDEIQGRFHGYSAGVTVPHLNMKDIRNLPLPIFPDLSTQRRIASILSAYDDLIENNNRRIALLEESMRLLYREWFVRLRFPGHEHVRMVDGLPEGWEKKSIGDIVNESRDLVDPNEIEPDTPYVGLEHIPRKSISLTNWGKASDVASSKFRFLQGDILFGKIRPYFHKVVFAPLDGICSSDTIVFRACYPELFGFALAVISNEDFVNFTSKTSKEGAKMPRANVSEMEKYPILFPKIEILWEFNKIVVNLTKQISNLVFTNNKLSEARDLLLPRLMSGEIDVS